MNDCWSQEEPELEHCPACLRTVKEGDKVHILLVCKFANFMIFTLFQNNIHLNMVAGAGKWGEKIPPGLLPALCNVQHHRQQKRLKQSKSKSITHRKHFINYHNQASTWQQDWLSHSLEALGIWNIIIKDHSPKYLSIILARQSAPPTVVEICNTQQYWKENSCRNIKILKQLVSFLNEFHQYIERWFLLLSHCQGQISSCTPTLTYCQSDLRVALPFSSVGLELTPFDTLKICARLQSVGKGSVNGRMRHGRRVNDTWEEEKWERGRRLVTRFPNCNANSTLSTRQRRGQSDVKLIPWHFLLQSSHMMYENSCVLFCTPQWCKTQHWSVVQHTESTQLSLVGEPIQQSLLSLAQTPKYAP